MKKKVLSTLWHFFLVLSLGTNSLFAQANTEKFTYLAPEQLNVIKGLGETNFGITVYPEGFHLKKYLQIELIPYQEYKKKKQTKYTFVINDNTDGVTITDSLIYFKTETDDFYLKNANYESYIRKHTYLGKIDFLNSYYVYTEEYNTDIKYESRVYEMYSIVTGDAVFSLKSCCYFSVDNKYSIDIYPFSKNEKNAFIFVSELKEEKLRYKMNATFRYWGISEKPDDLFYHSDGYFYLKITHIDNLKKYKALEEKAYQYARIKIL